jgi:hypothetical protein
MTNVECRVTNEAAEIVANGTLTGLAFKRGATFDNVSDCSCVKLPSGKNGTMAVLLLAHAPDGLVVVFANQQAAVFGDGDSDRATRDFAAGRDEAGQAQNETR